MKDLDNVQANLQNEIAKNEEEKEKMNAFVEDCAGQKENLIAQQDKMMLDLAETSGGKEKFVEEKAAAQAKHDEAQALAMEARKIVANSLEIIISPAPCGKL